MRTFLIIAAVTLLAFGCDKKEDQGTTSLPPKKVANEQPPDAVVKLKKTTETKADATAAKSTVDPVFKDYVYPNSEFEDTVSMGNTKSAIFKSTDGFVKVVSFYKEKFPDTNVQPGTTVSFGKTNEDGTSLTVTLTKLDSEIQIILRHDK